MPSIKNRLLALLTFFVASGMLYAQDDKETIGSETVVVVKPYTPSVSDAFKVKATPIMSDSISRTKKEIVYKIFSVPVASTFTPSKGTAAKVERARPIKIYDNYATLGAGNFTSALAEFYTNFEVNRGQNLGISLNHNSAQGGIEDVQLDDNYYDTSLQLDFSSRDRYTSYNLGVKALHKLYNWYGLPQDRTFTTAQLNTIDPTQNYFGGGFFGDVSLENSVFSKARGNINYFGDSHSSAEINAVARPEFKFDLGGERISLNAYADYLNTSFDRNYQSEADLNFSYLNLGVSPSILILRDDLELNLGASVVYNQDFENSDSNIFVYPKINASYRVASDYLIAYAGLNGELTQNTYQDFVEENPFVSPTLLVAPTNKQYEASLGFKGKLSDVIGYNLNGSYANAENTPLFLSNEDRTAFGGNLEDYQYGNSFGVVYDNISTISVFGELSFNVTNSLRLGINGEYFSYDTEFQEEAWNLPELKASLLADVKITEKLSAGANLFFVGEREAQRSSFVVTAVNGNNTITENRTLDAYFDANLQLDYQVNEQLSIFARGNNLLGENYEKWLDFPVYGIQGMAGATYKFDW